VAGKTNSELIRELDRLVAVLVERTLDLRTDLESAKAAHAQAVEESHGRATRLAVLEAQFADLKKALEESDRKRWAMWPPLWAPF
jgi:hypothetical protein